KKVFEALGFGYDFKMYCNEDFQTFIFEPICNNVNKISDTSELFLRSLKLVNIFTNNNNKHIKTTSAETSVLLQVTEEKIGVTAKKIFSELSKQHILEEREINNLCKESYSKQIFDLPFPVLVE